MQDYKNERSYLGEEPEGAAQRPLRAAGQGTAPSNTVPCNSRNDSETTILRTGIDTLHLSYPGDLYSEQSIRLQRCKDLAQSSDPQTAALAQLELGSHVFEVADKGRGIYPYVLRDGWYQLQVSKQFANNKPLAFALISSALLTTKSLSFILDDLAECIGDLGQVQGEPNLGRVDLCCDFVTSFPMAEIRESHWLTRARHIDRHEESKRFTGFSSVAAVRFPHGFITRPSRCARIPGRTWKRCGAMQAGMVWMTFGVWRFSSGASVSRSLARSLFPI